MKSDVVHEFRILAETRNFSKAAKRLFISQSTLSAHIKAMEEELGFDLITHVKKGFELTAAGKVFLEKTYELVEEYNLVVEQCREIASSQTPKIRLSCLHMPPNTTLFQEVFQAFKGDVIPYELDYHTTISEAIKSDKADMGLSLTFNGGIDGEDLNPNDPFEFEELGSLKMLVATSVDNPRFSDANDLTLESIKGSTVFIYNAAYNDLWNGLVESIFGDVSDINIKVIDLDNLTEYMYCSVENGLIVLPENDMRWYFSHRHDMRFFSEFNKAPIEASYGVYYRNNIANPRFEDLLGLFRTTSPVIAE